GVGKPPPPQISAFLATERRRNRTFQAGGCPALPESGREALAYVCTWAWRGPGCRPLTGTHHRTSVTAHRPRPVLSGRAPRDGVPAPVPFRTEHLLGVVVNWPSVGLTDDFCAPCWCVRRIPTHGRLTPCGN